MATVLGPRGSNNRSEVQGTGVRYRDEVLEPIVVPFAKNVGEKIIFMDENAHAHRARVMTEFL